MVPTFGMFDFMPERLGRAQADDGERQAYLAEVNRNSTQFGCYTENAAKTNADACLRMALMMRGGFLSF